jgi:molecular chaperone Hsp33
LALVSGFKFDGIFTLQISGNGPLHLLVVDITSSGNVRACARFDEESINAISLKKHSVQSIIGAGYLAFTIDQNTSDDRYQGTVELTGPTLAQCLHHFFRQSEQLATGVTVATNLTSDKESYKAAALYVQRIPNHAASDFSEIESENDGWLKTLSILGTTTSTELLDKSLPENDLLYRLFWEDGCRVFDEKHVQPQCRCSKERIESMLKTFSEGDIRDMVVDNKITVTCEFCSQTYDFQEEEFIA